MLHAAPVLRTRAAIRFASACGLGVVLALLSGCGSGEIEESGDPLAALPNGMTVCDLFPEEEAARYLGASDVGRFHTDEPECEYHAGEDGPVVSLEYADPADQPAESQELGAWAWALYAFRTDPEGGPDRSATRIDGLGDRAFAVERVEGGLPSVAVVWQNDGVLLVLTSSVQTDAQETLERATALSKTVDAKLD